MSSCPGQTASAADLPVAHSPCTVGTKTRASQPEDTEFWRPWLHIGCSSQTPGWPNPGFPSGKHSATPCSAFSQCSFTARHHCFHPGGKAAAAAPTAVPGWHWSHDHQLTGNYTALLSTCTILAGLEAERPISQNGRGQSKVRDV